MSKVSRWAAWVLMALVLVGLVGFGSTNFGTSANTVGTVGKTEISADRYWREMRTQLQELATQTGGNFTFAQAQAFGIDQQVLAQLFADVAVEDAMAGMKISIGDDELARRIREFEAFQNTTGKFDPETYKYVLESSGLKASDFEESLRAEATRGLLDRAVVDKVAMPGLYTDVIYAWARESRDFSWTRIGAEALDAPVGTPDDAALQAWYDAHPADFTTPETRNITYVWLRPEDVTGEVTVPEETLRALYEERIDQYVQPERRLVERLVFPTQVEATVAADRLAEGAVDFPALVAERGLELSDIDMGDVTEADLGEAGAAVFAAAIGDVVGPLQSTFGPAMFRVNGVLDALNVTFEDASDELQKDAALDDARALVADKMVALDDELAGGLTLEELADQEGLPLATIDWTAEISDGIAGYDAFRSAAAAATTDDYPEMAELSDGGAFAMRLNEIVAPALQPLDEVRDAAIAGWQAAETQAAIEAKAADLADALNGGATADELGLSLTAVTAMLRGDTVPGAPQPMVEAGFALTEGQWAAVPGADGAALVRLDAVTAADQTSDDAQAVKPDFATNASEAVARDMQSALAQALEATAGITYDQAVINAVNAQLQ